MRYDYLSEPFRAKIQGEQIGNLLLVESFIFFVVNWERAAKTF